MAMMIKKTTSKPIKSIKGLYKLTALLIIAIFVFSVVKWAFPSNENIITIAELQKEYALKNLLPLQINEFDRYKGIYLESEIYQGQKAYDEQHYQLAINHFERIVKAFPQRHDIAGYRALSYLHMGKEAEAFLCFSEIIRHPGKPFNIDQALWFTALIHLKNENILECKTVLDQMISLKNSNKELLKKALILRNKLEGR